MLRRLPLRRLTFVAVTALGALMLAAPKASAQLGGFPADAFEASSGSTGGGGGFSFFGGASGKQSHGFSKRYRPGQIIVSFSDRRLYHIVGRGRAVSYPISVPRSQSRWSGTLYVSRKAVNPTWTPTPRMRRENPRLPAFVPGGHPRNPMGVRALYLGSTMYRIHGTDAPHTIGKAVSKGCIRMHNSHVVDLYRKVRVGTKVVTTWKRYRS
ncbi:MAG: L,D-transpeptidase [Pseudomonadota bacterium]